MGIKLSIIIPCYNQGRFLLEALDSVNMYKNSDTIEIIIINDGSTDTETTTIIKTIEKEHTYIQVIQQQNLGLAATRNNGIQVSNGNYILPLDADNKLKPIFIEQAIEILDTNETIDVVYGNAQFFGNKTGIWHSKPFEFDEMVLNNYIDACACFRKSAWEKVGGYDEQMPYMGFEDWDLWLRFALRGFQFKYVNELFFEYRVREDSMLDRAWEHREAILTYMFAKKELYALANLRRNVLECRKLSKEPSFKELISIVAKKLKRKFVL